MCVEVYQSIGESFPECVCLYRKAGLMGGASRPGEAGPTLPAAALHVNEMEMCLLEW